MEQVMKKLFLSVALVVTVLSAHVQAEAAGRNTPEGAVGSGRPSAAAGAARFGQRTSVEAHPRAARFGHMTSAGARAQAGPGVQLSWKAPSDVKASDIAGYNIYRSEQVMGHYDRMNGRPVTELTFSDKGLVRGKNYYYKVTTVFKNGAESRSTEPVGLTAGSAGEYRLPVINFFTSDAVGRITYAGQEAVFILNGTPGLEAKFDIIGVASGITMKEVDSGSYRGAFTVTAGMRVKDTYALATLSDAQGGRSYKSTPQSISFLGFDKPAMTGLYVGILESDRVGLNWARQEVGPEGGYYAVYRGTSRILGVDGVTPLSGNIGKGVSAFIDYGVEAGARYYYVLALFDGGGNLVSQTENLEVQVPAAGHVSGIDTVEEDSNGATLRPGDVLTVTMKTKPGGKAYFSLSTAVRDMEMPESAPGVYAARYTVREGDGVFKSRVSVSFKDSSGDPHFTNSATFVSVDAPKGRAAAPSGRKPVIYEMREDSRTVAGVSGRLTAGKTVTVTITGEPGNKAYFSIGDGIWKVPMAEDPGIPGSYKGSYTVKPGDNAGTNPDPMKAVYLTGYLESPAGAVSDPASGAMPVVVDTTCNIKVDVSSGSLPADARSQTKVTFTVTDADGEPVRDRRLTLLLEPPAGYTGVVGAGGMEQARQGDQTMLGRLEVDFDDMTDQFGRVTATYTTGFAAKTAMIVARDYATGSVGIGYVTTSISTSVNVALTDPAGQPQVSAPAPVYQLQIDVVPDPANPVRTYPGFTVDAVPNSLTADGVSRANIIATLLKDGSPVQGNTIIFGVSGAGGTLTAQSAQTDAAGRAQVFYIAGKKAGKAVITATESSTGVYVTAVITLLPDAPAKILAKAYPDTLPADGASQSRIVVELADINNNPTDGVETRFALRGGNGSISTDSAVTDARGACDFLYTAGRTAGVATIDIYAQSRPPAPDELKAAYGQVDAPLVYDNFDFTELTVLQWYKAAGDKVGAGEPLALLQTPLGEATVYSPVSGVLDRITVDRGINVMEGKEIGVIR